MGRDGDGSLFYEPVRRADGRVDVEKSLAEYAALLDVHLRQSWMLRVRPKVRRKLTASILEHARQGWTNLDT